MGDETASGDRQQRSPSSVVAGDAASRRAFVIVNPVAGQSAPEKVRQVLDKELGPAGWSFSIHETSVDDDLPKVVGDALAEGCEIVIVAGGDGTVALVAGNLVGTNVPLAILPVGTGNLLSRELGIPQDLRRAAAAIVDEHRTIEVDAMRIGERHYFLNAGVGFPAAVMRDTSSKAKRRFGMLAYGRTAIEKMLQSRPTRFRLVVDGRARTVRAGFVMVANAGTLASSEVRWSKDTVVDDGILDVFVARARSPRDYVVLAWNLWNGRSVGDGPNRHFRAHRDVSITPARPLAAQADGEAIGTRSIGVQIVPRAVRFIVPMVAVTGEADQDPVQPDVRRETQFQQLVGHLLKPIWLLDAWAYRALNGLPHPAALNLAMRALSAAASKGIGWTVGLFVVSRLDPAHSGRALRQVLPTMWLAGLAIEFPIKRFFNRARPFASLMLTTVTGSKPNGYSFPSAHTAVSFAVAWLLRPHYPRFSPAVYALASTVAFSRLYLGVHYLSDVVVGAAAGTLIAEGMTRLMKALGRRS